MSIIPSVKLNSGYEIPLIGLGTGSLRDSQSKVDIAVEAALASGYRLFDTARNYRNEAELGIAFEKLLPKFNLRRSDIFITTKLLPPAKEDGCASELVPKMIEESLEKLKTDYLDLVLIHHPKPMGKEVDDPENYACRKETWLALEKISDSIIHSIGVSNFNVDHLEEMIGIDGYAHKPPAVNQVCFNPHNRQRELKEYCEAKGIFFQAYSSLGKMHPDLVSEKVIVELAEKHKTSVPNILLSFATSQRVGVIPKSENPQRIRDNLQCFDVHLSKEDIMEINSIPKDGARYGPRQLGQNALPPAAK